MNILTDELANSVEIDGIEYRINADFRTCIGIMIDFESNEFSDGEKVYLMIRSLYAETPENYSEAIRQGLKFLNLGEEREEQEANEYDGFAEATREDKYYSFTKDANLIFSAFLQMYGINLARAPLHWWEFVALMNGLGGDTAFANLVSLRKRVLTGKATKEEVDAARDMGDAFFVDEPEPLTEAEKESGDEFMRLLNGGIRDD